MRGREGGIGSWGQVHQLDLRNASGEHCRIPEGNADSIAISHDLPKLAVQRGAVVARGIERYHHAIIDGSLHLRVGASADQHAGRQIHLVMECSQLERILHMLEEVIALDDR